MDQNINNSTIKCAAIRMLHCPNASDRIGSSRAHHINVSKLDQELLVIGTDGTVCNLECFLSYQRRSFLCMRFNSADNRLLFYIYWAIYHHQSDPAYIWRANISYQFVAAHGPTELILLSLLSQSIYANRERNARWHQPQNFYLLKKLLIETIAHLNTNFITGTVY